MPLVPWVSALLWHCPLHLDSQRTAYETLMNSNHRRLLCFEMLPR